MEWLQIIVLGVVQGLTEFLPISSSGHLVLPGLLTDWPDQGLAFDVGVHFGSLIAVMIYFRTTLLGIAGDMVTYPRDRIYTDQIDLGFKLALATLPVAVSGFLLKDFVESELRSLEIIATATIVFGLALFWADQKHGMKETITWTAASLIGVAQVLALIPGTSRSGITITAALLLGLSRTRAASFSFLLAIPTILGAQLLLTIDLVEAGVGNWGELISGGILSGVTAYLCIHYFIALVERTGMLPYVIYRLLLGALLFAFILW